MLNWQAINGRMLNWQVKNDKLEFNIITPTTKSAERDVPISAKEIVQQGLMTPAEWDEVSCAVDFVGTSRSFAHASYGMASSTAWLEPCIDRV
jgi:phosphoribosylaminoimidazole-succinocarboxamide synthase